MRPVQLPLLWALFLFPENHIIVAAPRMVGVRQSLPCGFRAAPCDIVVLLAELLPRHSWLVATAAKTFLKIRFHSPRIVVLFIFTAYFDQALYAVQLFIDCLSFAAHYAQPQALTVLSQRPPLPTLFLHDFMPRFCAQRSPILRVLFQTFHCALRAKRRAWHRIFLSAVCAYTVFLKPLVSLSSVCALVKAYRPSPHRINSIADGRAIPLDLLRRESPTPIRVAKNLDELLHSGVYLCHKITSSCCASVSTRLHVLM